MMSYRVVAAPLALLKLMLADLQLIATNALVILELFRNLGRTGLPAMILIIIVLVALIMPTRILYRTLAFPHDLISLASNLKKQRTAQQLKVEGRNIYPLW